MTEQPRALPLPGSASFGGDQPPDMRAQERRFLLGRIAAVAQDASNTRSLVRVEEQAIVDARDECARLQESVTREFARMAVPQLQQASLLVNQLQPRLLSMVQPNPALEPPMEAQLVLEAACVARGLPADYRIAMQDPCLFLKSLQRVNFEAVTPEAVRALRPYILNPVFAPARLARLGLAIIPVLCVWVRALYDYHDVLARDAPKREKVHALEEDIVARQARLDDLRRKLTEMVSQVRLLENELDLLQYSTIGFG